MDSDIADSLTRSRVEQKRVLGQRAACEPFPDLDRRVDELLAHGAQREAQILAILARGDVSAGDIARNLPWTRRNRAFADLGEWHQQFAVSETIAHLHHLFVTGRVTRASGPDPIRYNPAA